MLAHNFKTAKDLGITEEQKDALTKVLVMLETGKLQHVTQYYAIEYGGTPKFTGHFNMDQWGDYFHNCGTVACIGGTAELIAGREIFGCGDVTGHLHDLFYPNFVVDWSRITTEEAATALRSYLTTGNARWDLAVA